MGWLDWFFVEALQNLRWRHHSSTVAARLAENLLVRDLLFNGLIFTIALITLSIQYIRVKELNPSEITNPLTGLMLPLAMCLLGWLYIASEVILFGDWVGHSSLFWSLYEYLFDDLSMGVSCARLAKNIVIRFSFLIGYIFTLAFIILSIRYFRAIRRRSADMR